MLIALLFSVILCAVLNVEEFLLGKMVEEEVVVMVEEEEGK